MNARRLALTSLGAGLVVGAAAPLASAATGIDTAPLIDSQNSTILAPSDQNSAAQNSVALAPSDQSSTAQNSTAQNSAAQGSAAQASNAPGPATSSSFGFAPLTPLAASDDSESSSISAPASVTTGLADGALTASEAALSGATTADWSRLGRLKLYPLAGTGVDPLSNVVATNIGGIPVSTQPVSQMVADGLPVNDLPVVGPLLNPPNVR